MPEVGLTQARTRSVNRSGPPSARAPIASADESSGEARASLHSSSPVMFRVLRVRGVVVKAGVLPLPLSNRRHGGQGGTAGVKNVYNTRIVPGGGFWSSPRAYNTTSARISPLLVQVRYPPSSRLLLVSILRFLIHVPVVRTCITRAFRWKASTSAYRSSWLKAVLG